MVRSWSSGSPRTMSPPTAPQPKPSTESCIPVRPNTRISIAVPPSERADRAATPPQIIAILFTGRFVDLGLEQTSPAEFGEFILDYTKKWGKVIRDATSSRIERVAGWSEATS
jgi:hypothetical protein